jgi:hypothetical protein
MSSLRSAAGLALGLVVACASPAAAENVLRWASATEALTFDPHAANHTPTQGSAAMSSGTGTTEPSTSSTRPRGQGSAAPAPSSGGAT